jgi:L-aminopeptidase/D-esterase-like protein
MITNTLSVGMVHHSVIAWGVKRGLEEGRYNYLASLPIVAETWDGALNDIRGQHVNKDHVFHALDSSASGPVAEGNIGGGTGMICHGFKGGTGTSSRKVSLNSTVYTVGVLVQANYGAMNQLRISGVPVGREIAAIWEKETKNESFVASKQLYFDVQNSRSENIDKAEGNPRSLDQGSIIIVVATDAPALPHQMKRLARRASLGLARNGSVSGNSSGDIFVAFSTSNPGADRAESPPPVAMLSNSELGRLFEPTVQATEEAVINALVAAETMTGIEDRKIRALPHEIVRQILKKYNRLLE